MCTISPSFHVPSLIYIHFFSFSGKTAMSPEHFCGKKHIQNIAQKRQKWVISCSPL